MKSSRGMYALAKARALGKGICHAYGRSEAAGFGLTYNELERIYAGEGFVVRRGGSKTLVINEHIENWKLAGLVQQVGDTIFFYLDAGDLSEMHNYAYIREYMSTAKAVDLIGINFDVLEGAE